MHGLDQGLAGAVRDASPLRLLLVEDQPADAELTLDLFEEAGVAVEWRHAQTLADVDCAAVESWAACALVDLGLPDSHGLDAVECLRQGAPSIPIVVLSGNVDITVALSCVRGGAMDYVIKGRVDGDLLMRTVRYAIERNLLDLEQHRTAAEAAELNEQLTTALTSRIVIDQATGIIAGHRQLPVELAFERLRRYARSHNRRLTDIARDTVLGRIPPSVFTVPPQTARASRSQQTTSPAPRPR